MRRIAIMGAGSWGTALAVVAGRAGHVVRLWARSAELVAAINDEHVNPVYLAAQRIEGDVRATTDAAAALDGAKLVILAAPSHATGAMLANIAPYVRPEMIVVSATKGIEVETGRRVSELVRDVLGAEHAARFVCLSGPSFAQEVAAGQPTAVVAASADRSLAEAGAG